MSEHEQPDGYSDPEPTPTEVIVPLKWRRYRVLEGAFVNLDLQFRQDAIRQLAARLRQDRVRDGRQLMHGAE